MSTPPVGTSSLTTWLCANALSLLYLFIAGAIANSIRNGSASVTVTGIGPASVLKATKSLALAADYLASDGYTGVTAVPRFVDMKLGSGDDSERTAVRFLVAATKA